MSTSARRDARLAGGFYVLVIVLGAYAELVGRQGFLVPDDAAAALHAIATHQAVYRLGFMAEMATNILAVPSTVLFLRLLWPVGPRLAFTALVLDLTQNTINAVNAGTQFAPLLLIPGAADLAGLAPGTPAALARLALRWHDVGFDIGLTFFGVALVMEGALVVRCGFLPRWLGALYMLAGASYLAGTTDYFLALHLPITLASQLVCFVGEAAMALWLLIVGVNDGRWRAIAAASERA